MDQFRPREDPSPVREIEKGLEDLKAALMQFFRGRGVWLGALVLLALYLASGLYVVGPGEKGVVLLFGKVYPPLAEPGLRYRLPKPIMSQAVVDVAAVRRAEIGFRSERGRVRPVPVESLMLTGDENIVDVQLVVQYRVSDPVKFLFGAQAPEAALRASAEVALRGVVGESTIDYTMTTGRMEIQTKVEGNLQKLLDTYDTGLQVSQARLQVVDPPTQVNEAFHDVVRAWEDRERLIKEAEGYREDVIPKARGMAQQEIREAEAYKAQRLIRAQGDAQRFESVLQEYSKSPNVTRERLYLESVEQFLPHSKKFIMEGGENSRVLPLLPLTGAHDLPSITAPTPPATQPSPEIKGK
jgi:modulator of FtsH protease HflK